MDLSNIMMNSQSFEQSFDTPKIIITSFRKKGNKLKIEGLDDLKNHLKPLRKLLSCGVAIITEEDSEPYLLAQAPKKKIDTITKYIKKLSQDYDIEIKKA